jgi:hypothetical protein
MDWASGPYFRSVRSSTTILAEASWSSLFLESYELVADATRRPSTIAGIVAMNPMPTLTMGQDSSLR